MVEQSRNSNSRSAESNEHGYVPPRSTDRRSPCPGINTLANHGFLPRAGKNIGYLELVQALRHGYNVSWALALFISAVAMYLCGRGFFLNRRLDLDALATHGKLEHDASLIHRDAPIGAKRAPIDVDRDLLKTLLTYAAPGHGMSLHDFARLRRDRETLLPRPLEGTVEKLACSEPVIAWFVMRDEASGEIPLERVQQFFGEERFPDDWTRPTKTIGLFESLRVVFSMAETVTKMIHASD